MNRFLPFVIALLLVFSSCAPATELQEITLTPSVTATVTSLPTPTETPTQIPDPYRIENGVLKEFSSGSYVEIESLGENATYELENGVLVAYYHPDREMFDVPAEGYKIGIRENGKWKFTEDTNFAFTLQPKQLKTLAEYLRDVNKYQNVSGENMVRHEIQIMRFGEFIGSRLETNLQTNHGKLQFIMLNTDKGFNEVIYLEPPEIAYRPAPHTWEGTTTWINGELTVEEISQILDRYQETTPYPAGKKQLFWSRFHSWFG